ncbi:conserved hypothetical protein [Coccidioides posadasii str. Silveira]|uniref:Protein kinase domain-containing protein n=1 Tax=Coccidioides posadasii (strain RMSCC 757 / Silveira) TaxID=443226 RepID=E9DJQ0_COCPS|nr:conserved hypothetical protein [Coccidioides posadasii str. Silveira]
MPKTCVGSIRKADTIYRDERGFDDSLKINIDFEKVEFVKTLRSSEASSIFHINYYGEARVLKVFHNNRDPGYASDHIRDLNRSRCEIRAYCRLKQFGICDTGFVPQFYGFAVDINPANCAPHLDAFQQDVNPPCAVLIEYLSRPQLLDCVTYTPERLQKAVIGLQQIHSARVEHNDPYPKNIMIVPGDPERVVWIDFDTAIVLPENGSIGGKEHQQIKFETAVVESFGQLLEEDQKKGLPPNTKFY